MLKTLALLLNVGLSQQGPLDVFTQYSDAKGGMGGDVTSGAFYKITKADILRAGLTISTKTISKDDMMKAKDSTISKENPFDNGRIETTLENCQKVCAVTKECLYYMWSDLKGQESYTRCYFYGNFGTYDKAFKKDWLGYKTMSNCGALFRQYVAKTLISQNYVLSQSSATQDFVFDPNGYWNNNPGAPKTEVGTNHYPQSNSNCPKISSVAFASATAALKQKTPSACKTDQFSTACNTLAVPLATASDYKYTMTYDFTAANKLYTETISGVLSVKSCRGSVPSGYMNMVTTHKQSLKTVEKLKLDAFGKAINTNCTLSSYDFKSKSPAIKALKQLSTCGLTDYTSDSCWVIAYPTSVFETMSYNLIVKYSTIASLKDSNAPKTVVWTDTIPQSIVVTCDKTIQACAPTVAAPAVTTPTVAPATTAAVVVKKDPNVLLYIFIGFAIFFGAGCCIFCICFVIFRQRREDRQRQAKQGQRVNKDITTEGDATLVEIVKKDGSVVEIVEKN